jgi:hypothetical protein
MSEFLGAENNDGVLMYVIHRGIDQLTNQVLTAANNVWNDVEHPSISLYGVAETNALTFPDAEIMAQTHIDTYPTILFVKVQDNQMIAILSRIEGGSTYNKIKREYLRVLKAEGNGTGQGGQEDLFDANGSGLGIGLGKLFGCPRFLPSWICQFPALLFVLILIVVILFMKKIIS